jgi:hypothetical protein
MQKKQILELGFFMSETCYVNHDETCMNFGPTKVCRFRDHFRASSVLEGRRTIAGGAEPPDHSPPEPPALAGRRPL